MRSFSNPPCPRSGWGGGPCEAWWRGYPDSVSPSTALRAVPLPTAAPQGGLTRPAQQLHDRPQPLRRAAMARIVMKFGGTSMAGIERIRHVAQLVKREAEAGHQLAVVVSAMAGETDRLIQFCREASSLYDPREYDVVVASGEQVTSGLLAITLQGMGLNARSYMGWQLPIRTSGHAAALIEGIDAAVLERVFDEGGIAVIPGFQGVTEHGDVATLGRGGSDTSAVALAAAVKADRCDIYTDVDGVYTPDPRIVPRARKLPAVTYEEMLELASVGAKVLQTRSVGLAMREKI